jgi:hypothetical protein
VVQVSQIGAIEIAILNSGLEISFSKAAWRRLQCLGKALESDTQIRRFGPTFLELALEFGARFETQARP